MKKYPPLGKCFKTNEETIQRLAVTPDVDWKLGGNDKALPPDEYQAKQAIDKDEHSLHFFEEDAFKTSPTTQLPTGPLKDDLTELEQLLGENADRVAEIDPSKKVKDPAHPTQADVLSHGTAPWRALQLYDLGVAALKAGDMAKATLYLGTMGHYVGDMSQPFHATLDYDGQASDAKGIHSVFEEQILEVAAKKAGAQQDKVSRLWSNFTATEGQVNASAKNALSGGSLEGFQREQIVPEITRLLDSGQRYVAPLTAAFSKENAKACAADLTQKNPNHPKIAMAVVTAFMGLAMPDPNREGSKSTVFEIAENRMGESSALVARMWNSAFEAAGRPALNCLGISFEQLGVIRNYPRPTYIPGIK